MTTLLLTQNESLLTHIGWYMTLVCIVLGSAQRLWPACASRPGFCKLDESRRFAGCLRALAADAAGQLDVLGHDGDALGVDGAQVGVLEQAHQVGLAGLLQRQDGAALEAQVRLEVLGNLADQALEGQLADEQLRALLVLADLAAGGKDTGPGRVSTTRVVCRYATSEQLGRPRPLSKAPNNPRGAER